MDDVHGESFIDFPAGSPGRLQSDKAFEKAGLARRVAFEATTPQFMLALVNRGLGTCLRPSGVISPDASLPTVPLVDGPVRTEYMGWDQFNPSPAARTFVDRVLNSHRTITKRAVVAFDQRVRSVHLGHPSPESEG